VDTIGILWGAFPARCEDCSTRFRVSGTSIFHAKCPRCLRQDLAAWDVHHYHTTAWMHLLMFLGAHRWRCEVCRCNFLSFRPRREKYVPPAQRASQEAHDYENRSKV
jgi:phage FluMu protein Com